MSKKVLISGAGTIGKRVLHVLDDTIETIVGKYSSKVQKGIDGKQIHPPVYLIDGDGLDQRLAQSKDNGMEIMGKIGSVSHNTLSPLDFSEIYAVIDSASGKGTKYNLDNNIYPKDKPLLVQGGTPLNVGDNITNFLSAPGTVSSKNMQDPLTNSPCARYKHFFLTL